MTSLNQERALLVHIDLPLPDQQADADELRRLVTSAGLEVVTMVTASRDRPDARTFIGSGKADEIVEQVRELGIDVVIFNHALSPAQERNLEKLSQCKVIDRVRLILDIFAQRAMSYEGKLQVELAQLQHLTTRLIRGWTHLERQKGGIGLRGPGETQLETDRRLIGQRIKAIRRRLQCVKRQRDQGRRLRERSDVPTVALVGYTNAGKSTLFNALTGADVLAADKLFATLDPTLRRLELPEGRDVVLSDTVGFIKDIPHNLIEAFHATLQEVQSADLLLHVVDCNDEQRLQNCDQVEQVIRDLKAGEIPQIMVYNKIDASDSITGAEIQRDDSGRATRVMVSAVTGAGLGLLCRVIAERLTADDSQHQLHLPVTASKLRSQLFAAGAVRNEQNDANGGWIVDVSMDEGRLLHLCRESGLEHAVLRGCDSE